LPAVYTYVSLPPSPAGALVTGTSDDRVVREVAANAVLCFDGTIGRDLDWDNFHKLKNNSLFVMRSIGGDGISAMKAADILLEKHATVVVYDYCLSACADAFLVASKETSVAKNTVVAWHSVPW
jgi:hypothetical protein